MILWLLWQLLPQKVCQEELATPVLRSALGSYIAEVRCPDVFLLEARTDGLGALRG